jgi:hypothetical protein
MAFPLSAHCCMAIPARAVALALVMFLGAGWDAGAEDRPGERELLAVRSHGQYHSVAFSPDGRHIAAGGPKHELMIWDAATGMEVRALSGARNELMDVAFSADGQWIAGGCRDGARVWDTATGNEAFVISGRGWVARLAFSPDGRRLAAGGPSIIAVWDVVNRKEIALLKGHTGSVSGIVYSPDGTVLASAGNDRTIRLWDAASGGELLTIRVHTSPVQTIAFSPDGRRLISASLDRTVRLWDSASGECLLTLNGHTAGVHCVAFSPDGRRAVSCGLDRTVKVWDLQTAQEVLTLHGHTGAVFGVAFSPDGRRLASTGNDATVKVWSLGVPRESTEALSAAELEKLWADLASDHGARAFHAVLTLAAVPRQSVAYLEEHLRPLPALPDQEKQIAQLLAELDDARFHTRQRATQKLEVLGKVVEPALRGLLAERPALEVSRRVERLLNRLKGTALSRDQLLAARGIEVLERADTPEAQRLLQKLAGGATTEWLTQEAKASLGRRKRSGG